MSALTDQVDALFAEWDKPDSPGCAVAIIRDGEMVYRRGYGCADLEHGVPISPDSVFDIASTSKQFTAMCIALLARQGKLSLEDPISRHIPEIPAYGSPITIRHLIHHTSGLRDYLTLMELAGMRYENEYPDEEIFGLIGRQKELNFEPGEEYLYSNTGYLLLGEIVKRVSGKSLRRFADEAIFAPLGMRKTHYHDDFTEIVKDRAVGYSPKRDGGFQIDMSIFDVVGDGCVYTTVDDLYLWDQNFYHNIIGNYGQDLIAEMITPGRLKSGEVIDYAFGLSKEKYRGLELISHSGDWAGYRSEMLRFPEQRYSVICLANLGSINPSRLARQIADLFLADAFGQPANEKKDQGAPEELELPVDELQSKTGLYRNPRTGTLWEIRMQDDRLLADSDDEKIVLMPTGLSRFGAKEGPYDIQVEFGQASSSGPARMQVEVEGGKPEILHKLQAALISAAELADYAGEYTCEELGVTYHLALEEGSLFLERKGNPAEMLKPVTRDFFKAGRLTLQFARDRQRQISGFQLRAESVRSLHFLGPGTAQT